MIRRLMLLCLLPPVLAGCAREDYADLRAFMEQAGAGMQQTLEPLPAMKPLDTFVYAPGDLPDPFKPRSLRPVTSGGGLQPDLTRPKGPLEHYPLDGLRMVGTLKRDGQMQALIRTPENTLYRVKQGDYIGLNFGRIVAIRETGLDIRETIQDGVGDWTEASTSMALQE